MIHCTTGIAGRIVTLANAMHTIGRLCFAWERNAHCPLPWECVFPRGLPGVMFQNTSGQYFGTTRIHGRPGDAAWPGVSYLEVIRHMAGTPSATCETAIIARFRRHRHLDPECFSRLAVSHCRGRVFLLADCHRETIANVLRSAGCSPVMPCAAELAHDMDRSAASVLAFLGDWKTALAAQVAITHSDPSALSIPAQRRILI